MCHVGTRAKPSSPLPRSTAERRGNHSKGFKDLYLKAKARIWPGLSCMCHVRSTAVLLVPYSLEGGHESRMRLRSASQAALSLPPKPSTPNPKPQPPNPKPQTPNPKPETPNPKPETPNPKPQTLCHKSSTWNTIQAASGSSGSEGEGDEDYGQKAKAKSKR